MTKKHCDKHDRFYYNCNDCQKAAKDAAKQEEEDKKIDTILSSEKKAAAPKEKAPERFRYVRINDRDVKINIKSMKKKLLLIIPVVIIIVALLTVFWIWPSWYGGISLNTQLYQNKAGGLNYIDVFFLNFWSTNFFFNKTALITGLIGSIIMSLPPNRNLLTMIGTRLRFGKPSILKALIFWWTAGFGVFYLLGYLIGFTGDFAWAMYLIESGQLQMQPTIILDAFSILFNPTIINLETMFIYTSIILPIISFVVGVFIFRAALNIASNYYLRRNDYNAIASGLLIGGLVLSIAFFSLPIFPLNGIELLQITAVIILFFTLIVLSPFVYIYGKRKISKDRGNYKIKIADIKKIGVVSVIAVFIALIPVFASIGPYLSLNNLSTWQDMEWNKKYARQIAWTDVCAGLDIFEQRPIENFTGAPITNDTTLISQIRQYDQSYAVPYLAAKIGTTFENLADSDIVYLDGKEYWVAPKTLKMSDTAISGDSINIHTELYDHVEGFLALDTFTGLDVNITTAFNITENYPIFFGEHERSYDSGAYDPDILLETGWLGNQTAGIDNIYEGEPDGVLTGLEAFWYTVNLNLLSYALEPGEHKYLINRNIKTRVENILLPGLRVDDDPYLVFDTAEGKMYYAVSIFTSINIASYSATPIYRFLGICLIDVVTGEMEFYQNPSLVKDTSDPTYNLWSIYLTRYNWQAAPNWLKDQLRYPETLFELQLEAYYIYHVIEPQTWKRGSDFHERPTDGDLFYIETDLGEGIEYVGLDVVEYYGQEARTLAGMYVIRHGIHFGEAIFYHTRDSSEQLIGPQTARNQYEATASTKISLIDNHRHGNTLLYPIGGSIYYYIPTYSTAEDSIQSLRLTGFVEAFTRDVGDGENVWLAYTALGITPPGTPILSTDADDPDGDADFNLNWIASASADSYTIYRYNETIAELNASHIEVASGLTGLSYHIDPDLAWLENDTYYFVVIAENAYGNSTSNCVEVDVRIPLPIEREFTIETSFTGGLADFSFQIKNINTNTSDTRGIDVNASLTFYRVGGVNISIAWISPILEPIENSTYLVGQNNGTTFTLFNGTMLTGDIIGSAIGILECLTLDIIIHYVWEVSLFDGEDDELYTIEGTINTPNT